MLNTRYLHTGLYLFHVRVLIECCKETVMSCFLFMEE